MEKYKCLSLEPTYLAAGGPQIWLYISKGKGNLVIFRICKSHEIKN